MSNQGNNVEKYFSNFKKFGIDGEIPATQIQNGIEFFQSIFAKDQKAQFLDLQDVDTIWLSNELSTASNYIQAFAINCFKLNPLPASPINIPSHEVKFINANGFSENDYLKTKKSAEKIFNHAQDLYYLNEFGYDRNIDLIKSISIKIELINPINDESEDISLNKPIKIKLPPAIHREVAKSIESILEKLTGKIDMFGGLEVRKGFAVKVLTQMVKEAFYPYLREVVYQNNRNLEYFPTDVEALLIGHVLVCAGIHPTQSEYKKMSIKNGARAIKKRNKFGNPTDKKGERTQKIQADRAYTTQLRDWVRDIKTSGSYYTTEYSAYDHIHELL